MDRYFQERPMEPILSRRMIRDRKEHQLDKIFVRGMNDYRKPSPTRLSRRGERLERNEEARADFLRATGKIRQVPGPQAPRQEGDDPSDGREQTQGTGDPVESDFFIRDGAVWFRHEGHEERVGRGAEEIGAWWRGLLYKAGGCTSKADYDALVERAFGGDE